MNAIEKLSMLAAEVCEGTCIYELSVSLARIFESVFNLYRTIPCYRYCGLFSIHSNFKRLCVEIHSYNSDSCNFIIAYDNDIGGPDKDKILVDASNCDFETLRRNIFRYLRSVDIKNEDASDIVHILKNPDGLEEGENYITAYDNIYKEQVAVDYANGNGFNPDIAVKIKENGDWVITKVIWCGKGS